MKLRESECDEARKSDEGRTKQTRFAFERGPKDIAYLGENETVRVLATFPGVGKYMMHCHNLVHEDRDMMVQYEMVDPNRAGDNPLGFPAAAERIAAPPGEPWNLPAEILERVPAAGLTVRVAA